MPPTKRPAQFVVTVAEGPLGKGYTKPVESRETLFAVLRDVLRLYRVVRVERVVDPS